MNKVVTIKDIALHAKVSTGTVDRVLHQRGKVSDKAKAAVLKAIDELDYKRNIAASALAYNKLRKIAVLIPDPKKDLYWKEVEKGLTKAANDVAHYKISVKLFPFDLLKPTSLLNQIKPLLEYNPEGMLFAPVFHTESVMLLDELQHKNIPIATINTLIEHNALTSYTGQNSYQSGVLAARLLDFSLKKNQTALILQLAKSSIKGRHYVNKSEGFIDYFDHNSEKKINVEIEESVDFNNKKKFTRFLDRIFKRYPAIGGVFVPNSRAHLVAAALPHDILSNLSLVGFDLIEPNIQCLMHNKISFLINQNAGQQGYMGIMNLVNKLVLKTEIVKLQYLPLDTVVKENVEYYINKPNQIQFVV